MDGEVVQSAAPSALERPAEGASLHVRRLESVLPGVFAAVLFSLLGISHGGYFATAWGPLTLAFLGVAAVALVLRPRPALGLRGLAVPGLLAAFALWALASSAWGVTTEAVPEAQRALAYAAGALAFALILRRERVAAFLVGVWAGICIVCLDALAGRLFPERFGEYDSVGVYRLSEPVGYWNALGVLAALGVLLAFSLAARVESLLVRLVAAASIVPLALTLYFTFSRGAWLALLAGIVFALALDPRRLQLFATLMVLLPWPALAVWLASTSDPLTATGHTLESASADGHQLAAAAVGLALVAAGAAAFAAGVGPRVRISSRFSTIANACLLTSLVVALLLAFTALGGPSQVWRSFTAPPRSVGDDLSRRLFDLSGSGRVDGWRIALDQAEDYPVAGSGGGSYKRYWLANRPYEGTISDAHSLYLESLAEYGPLGLALVVAVFAVPLGIAVRLRRRPLVPAAAGVIVLYAVHASVDWDWEFPVLTLVAIAAAIAITGSGEARPPRSERPRIALLVLVLALIPLAVLGGLGARAEAASADAAEERDYGRAADEARRAERLAPWSVEPLLLLGRAQAASGNRAAARATFERALRREPGNWRLWYELAAVSRGAERKAALREARALNPLESLLDALE